MNVDLSAVISRLRAHGTDDAECEVKSSAQKLSKDIWESVSAFGNTHGGLIILGLNEEEGFTPAKGFDVDRVLDQFVTGMGDGGQPSKLTNPPQYELERRDFEGAQILLISVKEVDARYKPCFVSDRGIQNGSYKRVDDKDIKLSATEIYELQNAVIPSPADGEVVPEATLDDLDGTLLDKIIANKRSKSPRSLRGADSREAQLERLNVIDKQGRVRLAGLLAAGFYPQQFFPKLVIDVAVHAGATKSTPGMPRFLDRIECEGPLGEAIEDAVAAVARNLRTQSYISGVGRKDELEIPEEALREAIVNAVIHREYSTFFLGQSVSVDVYPDRVEVTNPGGLWGGKTLENIADGTSRCRNDKLMKLMESTPLPHGAGTVAESQGSGIIAMIREVESRALAHPTFEATPDSFRVILWRFGAEVPEHRQWVRDVAGRDLTRQEDTLLLFARQRKGRLCVRDAHEGLGWDSDDIRALCDKLVGEGIVLEVEPDLFEIASESNSIQSDKPKRNRELSREMNDAILAVLSSRNPQSMKDVAQATGIPMSSLRYRMRRLVNEGKVVPTASATSKARKYILVE